MKKIIALVVTLALVGAFALNATMAYLTGETKPVENVFVIGDITVSLREDKWTAQGENFQGKIIPGVSMEKDPIVKVEKGSETCYVYMYLENTLAVRTDGSWDYVTPNINQSENPMANKWVLVDSKFDPQGVKKEVYRYQDVVDAKAADVELPFFSMVTVPGDSFTKESMQELSKKEQSMTVQAFAYQSQIVKLEDADQAAKDKFLSN